MKPKHLALYRHHYRDHDFERAHLFERIAERYGATSALYPGSFVHVTPSFVFPIVVFVDLDARAKRFFADAGLPSFVSEHKRYPEEPTIRFHAADYRGELDEPAEGFDLLISQYAGPVSQHTKRHLGIEGLLLANDSHGDASLASLDGDYRFVAAVLKGRAGYRLDTDDLERYFVPKSDVEVTRERIERMQRGIGYTKRASAYLFERTG